MTILFEDLLRQRVKRVYTIGRQAKIESQIKGAADIFHAETLEKPFFERRRIRSQVTSFFWRRPVPVLISLIVTNTAEESSRMSKSLKTRRAAEALNLNQIVIIVYKIHRKICPRSPARE